MNQAIFILQLILSTISSKNESLLCNLLEISRQRTVCVGLYFLSSSFGNVLLLYLSAVSLELLVAYELSRLTCHVAGPHGDV